MPDGACEFIEASSEAYGGDAWPPKQIDAALSRDGETFVQLPAPLILPDTVVSGSASIKTLRLLYLPEADRVLAVGNPHVTGSPGGLMYPLYWSIGSFSTPGPVGR